MTTGQKVFIGIGILAAYYFLFKKSASAATAPTATTPLPSYTPTALKPSGGGASTAVTPAGSAQQTFSQGWGTSPAAQAAQAQQQAAAQADIAATQEQQSQQSFNALSGDANLPTS